MTQGINENVPIVLHMVKTQQPHNFMQKTSQEQKYTLLIFNGYRLSHCPEGLNLTCEFSFGSTDEMQASATLLDLSSLLSRLLQPIIYNCKCNLTLRSSPPLEAKKVLK
jgi:hypothetical protein